MKKDQQRNGRDLQQSKPFEMQPPILLGNEL